MGRPKSISSVFRSRKTCKNSFRIKVINCFMLIVFTFSISCQLIENIFHGTRGILLFEIRGAVEGCDDTVYHDGDAVAVFRFIPIVGCDKAGYSFFGGIIDEGPELPAGVGGLSAVWALAAKES